MCNINSLPIIWISINDGYQCEAKISVTYIIDGVIQLQMCKMPFR